MKEFNGKKYFLKNGYWQRQEKGKLVRQHVEIAALALGKSLPIDAEVHHVDSNRGNNEKSNLVICPNGSYHHLLHRRTRALDACGNANWAKCKFCKEWDDPVNLLRHGSTEEIKLANTYHASCAAKYQASRVKRKAA